MAKKDDEGEFFNFIKGKLTGIGITITSDDDLHLHCEKLRQAVFTENGSLYLNDFMSTIMPYISGNQDFQRIIKMHFQEVTCVTLLKLPD